MQGALRQDRDGPRSTWSIRPRGATSSQLDSAPGFFECTHTMGTAGARVQNNSEHAC